MRNSSCKLPYCLQFLSLVELCLEFAFFFLRLSLMCEVVHSHQNTYRLFLFVADYLNGDLDWPSGWIIRIVYLHDDKSVTFFLLSLACGAEDCFAMGMNDLCNMASYSGFRSPPCHHIERFISSHYMSIKVEQVDNILGVIHCGPPLRCGLLYSSLNSFAFSYVGGDPGRSHQFISLVSNRIVPDFKHDSLYIGHSAERLTR